MGCFNGIRLGLEALSNGPDFLGPMADRMLVITSDGGEGITDAVKETRRIVRAAEKTRGLEPTKTPARFAFEYPGSVQGFMPCPYEPFPKARFTVGNASEAGEESGLHLRFEAVGEGQSASVSVATFLDIKEEYRNYETYVSPTLYAGQTVTVKTLCAAEHGPAMRPYVWCADGDNRLQKLCGPWTAPLYGEGEISWMVPGDGSLPVLRFGLEFASKKRFAGAVTVRSVDWSNTPEKLEQSGVMMRDMWDLNPFWAKMFVSSAQSFTPNLNCTYCISHPEPGGLATIGTRDFTDYTVSSVLKPSLHQRCGLVARSRGHRRYYAAVLSGGDTLSLVCRCDEDEYVLGSAPFSYEQFGKYPVSLTVRGSCLTARAGEVSVAAEDARFTSGTAGYLVDSGAVFIDGFLLTKET